MNELEHALRARSERGNPRGAEAVFAEAVRHVEWDEGPAPSPKRPSAVRLVGALAAVALVVGAAGWLVARGNDDDGRVTTAGSPEWRQGERGPLPLGGGGDKDAHWASVATDDALFVCCDDAGHLYDPTRDSWRTTSPPPIAARSGAVTVWNGDEVLIWGGYDSATGMPSSGAVYPEQGAAYDPSRDAWRTLPPAPIAPRADAVGVWAGSELYVWGGARHVGAPQPPSGIPAADRPADGAAFDPDTDRWRPVAALPARARSEGPNTAVWTGREVLLWVSQPEFGADNGFGATNRLFAYEPDADTWRELPRSPLQGWSMIAAWDGERFLALATASAPPVYDRVTLEAAAFDPTTGAWTELGPPPVATDVICVGAMAGRAGTSVAARCRGGAVHDGSGWHATQPLPGTVGGGTMHVVGDDVLYLAQDGVFRLTAPT